MVERMCRSRNLISLLMRVQTNSATVEISLEMSQVIKDTSFFLNHAKYCFFFPLSLSCSLAIQCGGQKQVFPNGDSSPGPGPDFSHNCSSDSPTLLSALPPPQRRKETKDSRHQQHLKKNPIDIITWVYLSQNPAAACQVWFLIFQRRQLLSLKVRETHPGGTVYLFPTHLSSLAIISSDP